MEAVKMFAKRLFYFSEKSLSKIHNKSESQNNMEFMELLQPQNKILSEEKKLSELKY